MLLSSISRGANGAYVQCNIVASPIYHLYIVRTGVSRAFNYKLTWFGLPKEPQIKDFFWQAIYIVAWGVKQIYMCTKFDEAVKDLRDLLCWSKHDWDPWRNEGSLPVHPEHPDNLPFPRPQLHHSLCSRLHIVVGSWPAAAWFCAALWTAACHTPFFYYLPSWPQTHVHWDAIQSIIFSVVLGCVSHCKLWERDRPHILLCLLAKWHLISRLSAQRCSNTFIT